MAATYGANATNLAEMFGVSAKTIRRHIQSAALDIKFHVGRSMNVEQRAAWKLFLGGGESHTATSPEVCESDREDIKEDRAGMSMQMDKFSLSFSGDIDIEMIANSLKRILGGNATGQVEIVCELAKHG